MLKELKIELKSGVVITLNKEEAIELKDSLNELFGVTPEKEYIPYWVPEVIRPYYPYQPSNPHTVYGDNIAPSEFTISDSSEDWSSSFHISTNIPEGSLMAVSTSDLMNIIATFDLDCKKLTGI